jgi:predicted GNAT family acetyltransferase
MEYFVQHEAGDQHGVFFILQDGERVGELTYQRVSAKLAIIDHTEVIPRLRGGGVARKLFDAAVAWARGNHVKLGATCSYAVALLARDPSVQDVRG